LLEIYLLYLSDQSLFIPKIIYLHNKLKFKHFFKPFQGDNSCRLHMFKCDPGSNN